MKPRNELKQNLLATGIGLAILAGVTLVLVAFVNAGLTYQHYLVVCLGVLIIGVFAWAIGQVVMMAMGWDK